MQERDGPRRATYLPVLMREGECWRSRWVW